MFICANSFWLLLLAQHTQRREGAQDHNYTKVLRVGSRSFELQVANTEASREKGLGDRDSLPADQGMIFVFDQVATQCFWMKDMRLSLDMIWADNQKKVTHIEQNVSPDTYPESFCAEGRYVVELNAGQARSARIAIGQTLNF